MPRNSPGKISRAEMISRLSSCNSGSRSSHNSKKCTWFLCPSQTPQASPAGNSGYAARPISSVSLRRAATSGVSPRRTLPPGKFHSIRYDERTSSSARPTKIATSAPSCRGHRSRHQMRASGKPRRNAIRQAASRSVKRRACPKSDRD